MLGVERWFNGTRTLTERIPLNGRTLKSIELDPENRFQDLDRTNNMWPKTP